jgi:hypothetical protein
VIPEVLNEVRRVWPDRAAVRRRPDALEVPRVSIGNTVKAEANQYVTSFPTRCPSREPHPAPVHRRRRARGGLGPRHAAQGARPGRHGLGDPARAWRRSGQPRELCRQDGSFKFDVTTLKGRQVKQSRVARSFEVHWRINRDLSTSRPQRSATGWWQRACGGREGVAGRPPADARKTTPTTSRTELGPTTPESQKDVTVWRRTFAAAGERLAQRARPHRPRDLIATPLRHPTGWTQGPIRSSSLFAPGHATTFPASAAPDGLTIPRITTDDDPDDLRQPRPPGDATASLAARSPQRTFGPPEGAVVGIDPGVLTLSSGVDGR